MKLTPFNSIHKDLSAKMVSFAGYEMPIQYPKGIIHEHKLIRNSVGIFDVTHMGEFHVSGKDALRFVQKCTVNDVAALKIGQAQYSAMCYKDGGIVDDLLVYRLGDNEFLLVVNASNIEKNFTWLQSNIGDFEVNFIDESNEYSLLAVQGPNSLKTIQKLTDYNMSAIDFYHFANNQKVAGINTIISRTGYTGELGFELYFKGSKEDAVKMWNSLMEAGKEYGIEAVGLGCRDTLRLEKGYALYGNDIDQNTNPIEAGLGWITKLNKESDFNGKDVLLKVKEENPNRRLVGFVVEADKFIARHGYKIFDGEKEIGVVTSGNLSPSLNIPIGMGYVLWDYKNPETNIQIEARGKKFPAKVKKMPLL